MTLLSSTETTPRRNEKRAPAGAAQLRGIHHLALNVEDLKTTLDFYVGILGMPLVHALTTPGPAGGSPSASHGLGTPRFPAIPHVFLDMGGDSCLAFFQYPKGEAQAADRDTIGAMQHVSFVCGPERFTEILERLKANGVEITAGPIVTIPPAVKSFYFFDPTGIRLEVVADFGSAETGFALIESCEMPAGEMRRELAKISDDREWIEQMIDSMVAHE